MSVYVVVDIEAFKLLAIIPIIPFTPRYHTEGNQETTRSSPVVMEL